MPLLIKNGRIVTATDDYTADIYCENQDDHPHIEGIISTRDVRERPPK